MQKCHVTGIVSDAAGNALPGATVRFTLTKREKDGTIVVMPSPVSVKLGQDGALAVDLWPNSRGNAGTIYVVTVDVPTDRMGGYITYPSWKALVPDQETAILNDISELVPPDSTNDALAAVLEAREARDAAQTYRDDTKALHDDVMPLAGAVAVVSEDVDAVNTVAAAREDIGTVAGLADEIATLVAIALDIETTAANIEAIRDVLTAAQTVTDVLASAAKLTGGNAFSGDQTVDGALGVGVLSPLMPLHVNGKGAIGDAVTSTRVTSGTPGSTGRALSLIDTAAVVRVWRRQTGGNSAVVELAVGDGSDNIADASIRRWDFGVTYNTNRFEFRYLTGAAQVAMSIQSDMRIGMGTQTPHSSAQLEVASTTRGFLPPRMMTTERDAIASPAEGLVIYNLTDHAPQFYDGSQWKSMAA